MFTILVLCTGNSIRSILAESLLNDRGSGRVKAFSAGSNPSGQVHPKAMALIEQYGLPTAGLRSKSWDEFSANGAPRMDLVITVCASAAAETCPIWPGAPLQAHWGLDDPGAAPADQIDLAFRLAWQRLSTRVEALLAMPFETMDRRDLAINLREIGERA